MEDEVIVEEYVPVSDALPSEPVVPTVVDTSVHYYVDAQGNFLGTYVGCTLEGAIEVPEPPEHFQQKWLGDSWGPVPKQVPYQVSAAQAQLALLDAGLLDEVEAMIEGTTNRTVKIWYNRANYWERNNPLLEALAQSLNLSNDQIDDLFILAATK